MSLVSISFSLSCLATTLLTLCGTRASLPCAVQQHDLLLHDAPLPPFATPPRSLFHTTWPSLFSTLRPPSSTPPCPPSAMNTNKDNDPAPQQPLPSTLHPKPSSITLHTLPATLQGDTYRGPRASPCCLAQTPRQQDLEHHADRSHTLQGTPS